MSELGQNLKDLVLKGIDKIGSTASGLASSTKQKVNELALKGKKNEILEALGEKVYEAWKNGAELPEELAADLREVMALDAELEKMNAVKDDAEAADDPGETEEPEDPAAPEGSDDAGQTEVPVIEIPAEEKAAPKETSVSDAIDNLFGETPQVEEMAGRINSSLDEMGKQLVQFSSDIGKKISEIADEMMGNSGKDE